MLSALSSACEPQVVVGLWSCPSDAGAGGADAGAMTKTVEVPWATSFETGFCDYARAAGFCYSDPDASYRIVDSPVHAGSRAAAFSVTADPAKTGAQARCFREGVLPTDATYGAWFYVPELANSTGNWNLMHFQGGAGPPTLHGLWDVSLRNAADGSLTLYVRDFLRGSTYPPSVPRAVPIGSWLHVEFRIQRAKDATGEVALYQDGALLWELTGLVTDDSDFGQWYVGNLANGLVPPDSTIYVDDVTIGTTPSPI